MKGIFVTILAALVGMASGMSEAEFKVLYERHDKDAEACYKLYEAYRDGDGVQKNEARARKWLLGAHKLGMPVYNEIANLPWRKRAGLKPGRKLTPRYNQETIEAKGKELCEVLAGEHASLRDLSGKEYSKEKASLVRKLLAEGADPNYRHKKHGTPLSMVCSAGSVNKKLARMLLDAGADFLAHDSVSMYSAFHHSMSEGKVPAKYRAGIQKNKKKHAEVIEFLVRHGADFTVQDTSGVPPLTRAASNGSPYTLDLLCKAGADPNLPCSPYEIAGPVDKTTYENNIFAVIDGCTPMFYCIWNSKAGHVAALLRNGADPELGDNTDRMPLPCAEKCLAKEDRPEYQQRFQNVIKLLKDAIAKKNAAAAEE